MSTEITLTQMLEAREARAARQQELLAAHRCPLICFTMNIAGPVKTSPLIERAFGAGLCALKQSLPAITHQEATVDPTGCTAYLAVDLPAEELKSICISIEEATPMGRLFDMDVLDTSGKKIERTALRGCIVCGAPGRDCAARRLHAVAELQAATTNILTDHFAKADARHFAALAVKSLTDEVHTTPKPGLVDRRNCGSHRDMDLPLFEKSAKALAPYFEECVKIGQTTQNRPHTETFAVLRQAGLAAEQTMYKATNGINTHKGAIFTLGLLTGALGRLWRAECPTPPPDVLLQEAADLVCEAARADLAAANGATNGLRLYKTYGLTGIRGEAAAGLPTVANIALPAYEDYLNQGYTQNDAGALTLLHLIAATQDTNLYHRGGPEGAKWAKTQAQNLLKDTPTITELEALDDAFIARNLSPGGSADLLAATYFLHEIIKNKFD